MISMNMDVSDMTVYGCCKTPKRISTSAGCFRGAYVRWEGLERNEFGDLDMTNCWGFSCALLFGFFMYLGLICCRTYLKQDLKLHKTDNAKTAHFTLHISI